MWSVIKKNFKMYVMIVLLFSSAVSAGLVIEKSFFGNFTVISGTHHVERIMKINQNNIHTDGESIDFVRFGRTYSFLEGYCNETKDNIKYNKLFTDWDKRHPEEKVKTLQKHIYIEKSGSNVYSCFLRINGSNNIAATAQLCNIFMDKFILYSEHELKKVNKDITVDVIEKSEYVPVVTVTDKKEIYIKYGYIGAVLGALIGITISVLHAYRGIYNV